MIESYQTLANRGEALLTEKGSKFYSFALKANSITLFEQRLNELQQQFSDSRHVCYAYRIIENGKVLENSHDAGEPSNTAGPPILGQITSANLLNTMVVVVRYFGGIKLGTGGLIRAYREAAKLAIENAPQLREHVLASYSLFFSYEQTKLIEGLVLTFGLNITNKTFDSTCSYNVDVAIGQKKTFEERLNLEGIRFLTL